mgnify:CR=1 FL=1|jgi:hypothetical protein|tara:strand:- start:51 stop:236 length:186 start_codon:yes stop_codon:yes gene_type:complete
MILSPNGEKIDHRKLKEACECFNELIKMQENLDKYEKWSMANIVHETAMQLAHTITEKLKQ